MLDITGRELTKRELLQCPAARAQFCVASDAATAELEQF